MKFRKKPVVIEAVQWDGSFTSIRQIKELCTTVDQVLFDMESMTAIIHTLEGDMLCSPGDWIIKGIKNELYPCKPDIFAATYEEV